jgi:hypothetical protein
VEAEKEGRHEKRAGNMRPSERERERKSLEEGPHSLCPYI